MTLQNPSADDAITRGELHKKLSDRMTGPSATFADYFSPPLIDSIINEILRERNEVPVKITEKAEKDATLTLGELDAALTRMGCSTGLLVGSIYKNVVEHREPEWKPGDVVKDAAGTLYRRTSHGGWKTFGSAATYLHDYPARPLKKIDI